MKVLAIDPGNTEGRAEFRDGRLVSAYSVNMSTVAEKYAHLKSYRPNYLVVEDQFLRFGNAKSFKTLVLNRAQWQVLATLLGITVVTVGPSTWMAHCGVFKKTDKEKLIKAKASALLCERVESIDAACAACIGQWFIETGGSGNDRKNVRPNGVSRRTRRTRPAKRRKKTGRRRAS